MRKFKFPWVPFIVLAGLSMIFYTRGAGSIL